MSAYSIDLKLNASMIFTLFFLSCLSTSSAQVASPKHLKLTLNDGYAVLTWGVPDSGTAYQYYIYKAFGSSTDADPSSLNFARYDSTSDIYYTDDLSSVPDSTPVLFYYVTAADTVGPQSLPSNMVISDSKKKAK